MITGLFKFFSIKVLNYSSKELIQKYLYSKKFIAVLVQSTMFMRLIVCTTQIFRQNPKTSWKEFLCHCEEQSLTKFSTCFISKQKERRANSSPDSVSGTVQLQWDRFVSCWRQPVGHTHMISNKQAAKEADTSCQQCYPNWPQTVVTLMEY